MNKKQQIAFGARLIWKRLKTNKTFALACIKLQTYF